MKSNLTEKWIVCRVCLKQPKTEAMNTIFDDNADKDLTRMILECGGVPIKKYDHYPDKICSKCLRYLRVAHKFRVTCQRSYNHLSRFIAPVEVDEKVDPVLDQLENDLSVEMTDEQHSLEAEEADDTERDDAERDDAERDAAEMSDDVIDTEEKLRDKILEPPLSADDEAIMAEIEAIDIDHRIIDYAEPIEYLEDFVDEVASSEEEFILYEKPSTAKKSRTTRQQQQNKMTLRKATARRAATAVRGKRTISSDGSGGKRIPRQRKLKDSAYICDICGNQYPSQGRLTEHIKLHKGIKPHECEICGHAFAQTQQLARHMNTHTGNRPYKCNYCPAAFADLSTRNKHHRIHTNERPYVCDVCGKSFTYTNTLKFHKMIHTGEKPHVCDICGKGFQQAYKLRSHKRTHDKKLVKLERIEAEEVEDVEEGTNAYQEVSAATAQILEI